MTLKTVPLASLIEDSTVYVRHAVDSTYVNQLAEALRAGAKLPPPVVEAKTMRIVDGWNRTRAHRQVLGDTGSIDVDLRKFASEAELIHAAVDYNMTHGKRLDRMDRVRLPAHVGGARVSS